MLPNVHPAVASHRECVAHGEHATHQVARLRPDVEQGGDRRAERRDVDLAAVRRVPRHDRRERRDDQSVAVAAVVQRPAAGEVARRDQSTSLAIPHDERVVALEPLRAVASPRAVCVEDEMRRAVAARARTAGPPSRRGSRGADRPGSRSRRRRRRAARRRPPRWDPGLDSSSHAKRPPASRLPPPLSPRCVRRRATPCRERRARASRQRAVRRRPRRRSRSSARDDRGRRGVLRRARRVHLVSAVERARLRGRAPARRRWRAAVDAFARRVRTA